MNLVRTFHQKTAPALALLFMVGLAPPSSAQTDATSRPIPEAIEIIAEVTPDNPNPRQGDTITVAINIDTRNLQGPDNRLAAYQSRLEWQPAVLQFLQFSPGPAPWNRPNVDTSLAASGRITWNAFIAGGAPRGQYTLLTLKFKAVGAGNSFTKVDLSFSELTTSFARNILSLLQVNDIDIEVQPANRAPQLDAIATQTVEEGRTRSVAVRATDPDGDRLTLLPSNFPAFMQLTDNGDGTGLISIQPKIGDARTYPNLAVIALDNGSPALSDTSRFEVIINPAENPPVLDSIPDQTMKENEILEVAVKANDPDGDDIILKVLNLPRFGIFTDNHNGTGVIRFAPGFDDAGVYPDIDISATDNSTPPLTAKRTLKLTVLNVNRTPDLQALAASIRVDEGGILDLNLTATDVDGDSLRFSTRNLPAFCRLTDNRDGTAKLRIAPGANDAGDYPNLTMIVTDNGAPNLFDSEVFNLTIVDVVAPLICSVKITQPLLNASICGDSVTVCLRSTVTGGVPPLTIKCEVNGFAVRDSCVTVPLVSGSNKLLAKCTVTDAQGAICASRDSISVRASIMRSQLTINTPTDSTFICANTINVGGTFTRAGGLPPFKSVCTINGVTVSSSNNAFGGTATLIPGFNRIIAACTITDSFGCSVTSSDTVVAFSDPTPAEGTINFDKLPIITGEIVDLESGIAKVEIIEATNRVVTIAPFKIGDKKVTFSSDKIDPNKISSFTLRVTNRAGCEAIVDPVHLRITASRQAYDLSFNILSTDRFLFVRNNGMQSIRLSINGHALALQARPEGAGRQGNLYFMANYGIRSLDITHLMVAGENNIDLVCSGPRGSSAELLFSDVFVPEGSATGVEETEAPNGALPETFALGANFPNPFNPETAITFDVPAGWTEPVTLRLFNVQGQLVRTLFEGAMPPGQHKILWNGKDQTGQAVSTGVYLYQIISGDFRAVRKMLMAK